MLIMTCVIERRTALFYMKMHIISVVEIGTIFEIFLVDRGPMIDSVG